MNKTELLHVFYNLQAARLLIDDFNAWVVQAMSTTDHFELGEVPPRHRYARCWCAAGAILATAPEPNDFLALRMLGMQRTVDYNDSHKHAQVLRWLDIQIKNVARRIDALA